MVVPPPPTPRPVDPPSLELVSGTGSDIFASIRPHSTHLYRAAGRCNLFGAIYSCNRINCGHAPALVPESLTKQTVMGQVGNGYKVIAVASRHYPMGLTKVVAVHSSASSLL